MTLPKKINAESNYRTLAQELEAGTLKLKSCQNEHTDIFYNVGVECPLCEALRISHYYVIQSKELKNKYEILHQAALELSPEILL
jgi:hypothetical protein